MRAALGVLAVAAVGAGALVAGRTLFTGFAVLVGGIATLDVAATLRRTRSTAILPAALVLGIGAPAAVASSAGEWGVLSGVAAAAFFTAVVLAMLLGLRRGVVRALGTTMTVGMLAGIGAASWVLLADVGMRWAAAVVVPVVLVEVAGPVWRRLRGEQLPSPFAPAIVGAVLGAAAVAVALSPPITPGVAVALAAVVVAAWGAARALWEVVTAEAIRKLPGGAVTAALDTFLLAGPAAYLVARVAAL